MKQRKLGLLIIGMLTISAAMGCDQGNGGTVSDAAAPTSSTPAASVPGFTPADPNAKAAMDAKEAKETDAEALKKPGEEQSRSSADTTAGAATAAPGATMPKAGDKVAVINTNLGTIVLKFFPNKAPGHVKNFIDLANKKFYDGTKFHRVIPGFMIQGGDPYSKTGAGPVGTGGPGYTIKAEFNDMKHTRGILSMARSSDPDSAGSQFFITVADTPQLDNQYTIFGQVVKGMDVVDKIVNLPRDDKDMPTPNEAVMKTVTITTWPLKK